MIFKTKVSLKNGLDLNAIFPKIGMYWQHPRPLNEKPEWWKLVEIEGKGKFWGISEISGERKYNTVENFKKCIGTEEAYLLSLNPPSD